MTSGSKPKVAIIMGSKSDLETMKDAQKVLDDFGVGSEMRVVSAHRAPHLLYEYAQAAPGRGIEVIIAGAGGAAHLAGVTAALVTIPVIGVPIESKALKGMDSLLSTVQMPGGVPVATVAIGNAKNAGVLAVRILALGDAGLRSKLADYHKKMAKEIAEIQI
ncbi:MAG: 5-(carboxyamino)imidazole ribonucleotide mutase [Candidatus Micrarchaeota archaeon]|nr:5-(carboxyamino)imidazole ribonucleotide mutase [Candidatus Micrarchaeota archaeon]